jgi:8-oxo-dGTP diphosphatase
MKFVPRSLPAASRPVTPSRPGLPATRLQFGTAEPGLDYQPRATAFGLVIHDGKLACVRIDRGEGSYLDLPGGAVDGNETEEQTLVREFLEETGMTVRPLTRIAEASQYFCKTDGRPLNNTGGFWIAEQLSLDPAAKVEKARRLLQRGEYNEARWALDGLEGDEAAGLRAEAMGGLRQLNLDEALARLRLGDRAVGEELLALATEFGATHDEVQAIRGTVRREQAEERAAAAARSARARSGSPARAAIVPV